MSTKMIVSAEIVMTPLKVKALKVRVETHYNGHIEEWFTEYISQVDLSIALFDFGDYVVENYLFWKYVLDAEINAHLEREEFGFEINYHAPCIKP